MTKVFIDGSSGTTGLRIYERLGARKDIELIILSDDKRKDPDARKEAICNADIAFLCLPDDAAREAVSLAGDADTVLIDTSTAHRTNDEWAYGFSEINGLKDRIIHSQRIANPGCHASGFISLAAPLVSAGIISADAELSCFSLTGYSGGGKKMIADYESEERDVLLKGPRMYGLGQVHKHLPEMSKIAGLNKAPVFCPVVGDFYSGMEVVISLFKDQINGSLSDISDVYADYYKDAVLVSFAGDRSESGFLSAAAFSGRDDMEITLQGNDDRVILISRFDNLGKGASGAAIQNMNLVMGIDETTGLNLG